MSEPLIGEKPEDTSKPLPWTNIWLALIVFVLAAGLGEIASILREALQ